MTPRRKTRRCIEGARGRGANRGASCGGFRIPTREARGSVTVPRRMAARKVRRDVTGRVREPGFTPGVRDVPAIVLLLGTRDEELARDAERALVRVGPTVVPIVRAEAQSASAEVRARLVRVVGALLGGDGESENEEAIAWLIDELRRGEGEGARYAATALGKLRGGDGCGRAGASRGVGAVRADRAPPCARRCARQGRYGGVGGGATRVPDGRSGAQATRRRARSCVSIERAARSETSAIDGGASLERPWPIVFRCRAGLESMLVDELGDGASALRAARSAPGVVSPRATEEGRVQAVLRGPLSSARVARTAMSFALLLGPESGTDEAALVARSARVGRGVADSPDVHARTDPLPARVRVGGASARLSCIAWRRSVRGAQPGGDERPDRAARGRRSFASTASPRPDERPRTGTCVRSRSSSSRALCRTSASPTGSPTSRPRRTRRLQLRSRGSAKPARTTSCGIRSSARRSSSSSARASGRTPRFTGPTSTRGRSKRRGRTSRAQGSRGCTSFMPTRP